MLSITSFTSKTSFTLEILSKVTIVAVLYFVSISRSISCVSWANSIAFVISAIEEEVESLRRKITREVADVGGLMLNRENLLNTAYTMDEIAGYITGIAFKMSNVKTATLKNAQVYENVTDLINLVVDEIQKLNEVVRMLNTDITKAIEFAQETQDIEREIDTKYRTATIVTLDKISNVKEVLLVKDVIESIEEMADKCQKVSDTFIMLALSL